MELRGASRYIPSSRVSALMIVVVAIIVATVIIRADDAAPDAPVARLIGEQRAFDETDTDGDAVPDWEEALWGLSSVTPDTDGDGVGDADEIRQSKELFDELPRDLLAQASSESEAPTPIGLAGRILVSQFLVSKQAGVPFTEDEVRNAAEVAASGASSERTYKTYTASDITVGGKSTGAALRAYGNAIGDALKNTSGEPAKHELGVLLSFTQSQDTDQLSADMQDVVGRYQTTIDRLLAIIPPSDAAALHLATVNALERVKTDLADMGAIGTDPFAALAALSSYADNSSLMVSHFNSLRELFARNDVTFAASESGYAFMNAEQ